MKMAATIMGTMGTGMVVGGGGGGGGEEGGGGSQSGAATMMKRCVLGVGVGVGVGRCGCMGGVSVESEVALCPGCWQWQYFRLVVGVGLKGAYQVLSFSLFVHTHVIWRMYCLCRY